MTSTQAITYSEGELIQGLNATQNALIEHYRTEIRRLQRLCSEYVAEIVLCKDNANVNLPELQYRLSEMTQGFKDRGIRILVLEEANREILRDYNDMVGIMATLQQQYDVTVREAQTSYARVVRMREILDS